MADTLFRLDVNDVDCAFAQNEFRLVFQPQIDLATGRMTAAEALVRWQHPTYGLLPPGLFLDFLEAAGRMPHLTAFVFREALAAASIWNRHGRAWDISVNVAPGTVTVPGFCHRLARQLDTSRLRPAQLIVEIPERVIVQEAGNLSSALNDLRALGVQLALDGSGAVPVDLEAFNPMPFTAIKVAGPASIRLAQRQGRQGRGVLAARLRQARRFGLAAIAVGTEDEATMEGLTELGFTGAQGIWIQRPLTSADLLAWDGRWTRASLPSARPGAATLPEASRIAM
jgi:EAL domain-containing protein (putative c-di-GMP-specific phosphodiesterase class I)